MCCPGMAPLHGRKCDSHFFGEFVRWCSIMDCDDGWSEVGHIWYHQNPYGAGGFIISWFVQDVIFLNALLCFWQQP